VGLIDPDESIAALRAETDSLRRRPGFADLGPDWSLVGPPSATPADRADESAGGPVVLVRGGKEVQGYEVLQEALNVVRAGDEIELRTDRVLNGGRVPPDRGAVTVRAARGYRPILKTNLIVSDGGSLTVEGVHFLGCGLYRPAPAGGKAGELSRVVRCAFTGGAGAGIVSDDTDEPGGDCEIIGCLIRDRVKYRGRVTIRNSVVGSVTPVQGKDEVRLKMDRCVVWNNKRFERYGSFAFTEPGRGVVQAVKPFVYEVRRSLIDSCQSLIPSTDEKVFHWNGTGNVYRIASIAWSDKVRSLAAWRGLHGCVEEGSTEADPWLFNPANWAQLPDSPGQGFGADVSRIGVTAR
jgi:hypothetical protein